MAGIKSEASAACVADGTNEGSSPSCGASVRMLCHDQRIC
jgi:hypothetical protein